MKEIDSYQGGAPRGAELAPMPVGSGSPSDASNSKSKNKNRSLSLSDYLLGDSSHGSHRRARGNSLEAEEGARGGKKKTLGLFALCSLTYYSVSGGPFGFESVVQAGGPFWALTGFALILVWALPEALITIEMSIVFPESSGSVAWVEAAYGAKWGFMKGWLSLLSGIADNSLYPLLFLDCVVHLLVDDEGDVPSWSENYTLRYVITCAITLGLAYVNYRGLDLVGKLAIFVCLFTLAPFVVFCVLGSFKVQPHRWSQGPTGGFKDVNWRLLLNTFYWNLNYWDSAATFSGDVINPEKNYPSGILLAVLLVFMSTFLPILVGTGAYEGDWSDWSDGFFITLGVEIVGPWLGYWMLLASTMTNVGMFEAEMSSDAWQVAGMAERGIIPKIFGQRSKYESPHYGVLLSLLGVLFITVMDFTSVIDLLNMLFCFSQALEFLAYLKLKADYPTLHKPWKVPLPDVVITAMLVLPICFTAIIIYFSSAQALLISTVLACLGFLVHFLIEKARLEEWCEFEPYVPWSSGMREKLGDSSIYLPT